MALWPWCPLCSTPNRKSQSPAQFDYTSDPNVVSVRAPEVLGFHNCCKTSNWSSQFQRLRGMRWREITCVRRDGSGYAYSRVSPRYSGNWPDYRAHLRFDRRHHFVTFFWNVESPRDDCLIWKEAWHFLPQNSHPWWINCRLFEKWSEPFTGQTVVWLMCLINTPNPNLNLGYIFMCLTHTCMKLHLPNRKETQVANLAKWQQNLFWSLADQISASHSLNRTIFFTSFNPGTAKPKL